MLNHNLCIHVEKEEFGLPHVRIFPDEKWVKHVYCQWSHFHVLSYYGRHDGSVLVRCNEPDCIANASAAEQKRAADWLREKWMDEHPHQIANR
jgi:hypothetical protein